MTSEKGANTKEQKTTNQAKPDPKDVEKNKTMAMLAYLIFFLPLITDAKDSPFAKFHANQALMVFLLAVIGSIVSSFIPFIGWFILAPAVSIASIIFFVMGLVNANNGELKELPIIGGIHIIDK